MVSADKLAAYCNANKQIELYFESVNAENAIVQVINVAGQTVASQKAMVGTSTINAILEPGVYMIKVNQLSRKVIIK